MGTEIDLRQVMAQVGGQWARRIVGVGVENPAVLAANPKNWRLHTERQRGALTDVLDDVGWVQFVIVNKLSGFIVDGHLRVALALEKGEGLVPVVYVELSEAEEDKVLATFDPISAMAGRDAAKLEQLLAGIKPEQERVGALVETLREDARIEATVQAGGDRNWDSAFSPDAITRELQRDKAETCWTCGQQCTGTALRKLQAARNGAADSGSMNETAEVANVVA